MVKDSILTMSSALLKEIKSLDSNMNEGFVAEAYKNYKNTIELYLYLENELPKNHKILKNAKKVLSSFKPVMEKYLVKDAEVISLISEATKAEKDAIKAEKEAKKAEIEKIKKTKKELQDYIRILKDDYDGLHGAIFAKAPNFRLGRYHISVIEEICDKMKAIIAALIGEETTQTETTEEDTF